MSNAVVRSYFETRLKDFALAQSPVLPISYQNVPFTKPGTYASFLECNLYPAPVKNVTTDGTRKRYTGTFQINVWTKSGIGSKAGETLAQALADLFPIVPKGAVSVEETPSMRTAILDEAGYSIIPVTILYRLEA